MRDIPTIELDALQSHSSMLSALLNESTDSIYFKDHRCRFVMVSHTKAQHLGLPVHKIIGKTDHDFLPQDEAHQAFKNDMRVITTGQPIELEEELTRPDGSFVWNSVKKAPWRNREGEIIGMFGITRDITMRKKYEHHILDMLTIATHDIRNPLASMGMTLKLLMRGSFGPIDDSVKATIEDLSSRNLRLERIVTDYLCIPQFNEEVQHLEKQSYSWYSGWTWKKDTVTSV